MKQETAQKTEDPQLFVLGKLIKMTQAIRRNGLPEEAEIAAKYESQFNRDLAQGQKKAA
jgi:hypothetical protein